MNKSVNETKWLCENAKVLEKYSGQVVTLDVRQNLITPLAREKAVLTKDVFVFHVPSKHELSLPLPVPSRH